MSDLNNGLTPDIDFMHAEERGVNGDKVQGMLFEIRIKGDSRKKRIIGILIILLILAVSGYGYTKWSGSSNSQDYITVSITRATISDSVEATGTLSPVKQSAMGFKNDDTITAINVQVGDQVKAGQILAQQDPTSLQATLQQAKSTVEQDQINVQSAMLTYESNRKTLERQQKLFDAGALAQSDLDAAQNSLAKSEWDVATAKSKLSIDQTKVEQAQDDLSGCTLVAPFDGIIGEVNGQVGQINGLSSSASTLLTVMSTDLQLTALVNEADIGRIKLGQSVEFTSSSYSDRTFKGKVLRITPQASTVSNVQYYPVSVSCIDPDRQLLSGMSVTVNIIVAQQKDVLTVPMMAVSYAQTYIKSNPAAVQKNTTQTGAAETNMVSKTQSVQVRGNRTQKSGSETRSSANNMQAEKASETGTQKSKSAFVVVIKNRQQTLKNVLLGLSDGSNYEVIKGLDEGEKVVVGSSQLNSQTDSSDASSSKSSTNLRRNKSGVGMEGPPPGM